MTSHSPAASFASPESPGFRAHRSIPDLSSAGPSFGLRSRSGSRRSPRPPNASTGSPPRPPADALPRWRDLRGGLMEPGARSGERELGDEGAHEANGDAGEGAEEVVLGKLAILELLEASERF